MTPLFTQFMMLGFALLATAAPKKPETLESMILDSLPEKVQKLIPGKTTLAETTGLLGTAMKGSTKKESFFQASIPDKTLDVSDLTVGFDGNKVRYIVYNFTPGKFSKPVMLDALKSLIPAEALKSAMQQKGAGARKHEAGRILEVKIPEKGLILTFKNTDKPKLKSVLIWTAGEKLP